MGLGMASSRCRLFGAQSGINPVHQGGNFRIIPFITFNIGFNSIPSPFYGVHLAGRTCTELMILKKTVLYKTFNLKRALVLRWHFVDFRQHHELAPIDNVTGADELDPVLDCCR